MALTENLGTTLRLKEGDIHTYPVAGGVHIYRGATVAVALSGDTAGYAAPAISVDTIKQLVVGVAQEEKNATALASGALSVRVRGGAWKRKKSGAAQSDVGKLACIEDDETVRLYNVAAESNIVVGRITELDDVEVYVNFNDRPSRVAASASD